MSSFRHDAPVASTRKKHRCVWCSYPIEVGASAVRVSGSSVDGFWDGIFHPECWRAEQIWWADNPGEDGWPYPPMTRGRADDYGARPEFTDTPITSLDIHQNVADVLMCQRMNLAHSWLTKR